MTEPFSLPLIATGYLLGWSVAWPPGPINAEIARRCVARGYWAGFGLLLGACSGDALWAILVSLGVGVLFTGPMMKSIMGVVSVGLLLLMGFMFLRGAWRAWQRDGAEAPAPSKFDSHRASFLLGIVLALTSPWNVAFWLATMGRPEAVSLGTSALLTMTAAVLAGALTWGVLWSGFIVLFKGKAGSENSAKWWDVGVRALTGLLMLYFAIHSARALWG